MITLNAPKTITVKTAKTITVTTLTLERVIDLPAKKIVKAWIKELNAPVVLWEGAAYDSIGQWTDSDVTARLNALYNA